MRVFKETQRFRRWWLFLILGTALLVTAIPVLKYDHNSVFNPWEFLGIILVSSLVVLFWKLRLKTRIDATGISTRFVPLSFFKKHFHWKEIDSCYVRKYLPIQEYGGWGVRGTGKSRAYNVSGNMGIQVVTRDKRKFLIGTDKPEEAERILKRYRKNIKYYEEYNSKHRPFSDSTISPRPGKVQRGRS
ncbi:hypothetical protein E0K83_11480 [Gramella sp. BOM4]|nr:hypothetical protein [Christiangramia bathymodioli]